MRVLVVEPGPDYSVQDVADGLIKGLGQCGAEVARFNFSDRLSFYAAAELERDGEHIRAFGRDDAIRLAAKGISAACYEFWPDVVVVVSGFFVPPEMWGVLARRPHHVVLWCTESPYEDAQQMQPARYAHTVVLNDPTNIESFRQVNDRVFYMPHSYDPDRHYPSDTAKTHDFVFVGTGFPSRIEFFEKVDWTGIDARFAGNWQGLDDTSPLRPFLMDLPEHCLDNAAAADLYRSARVTANVYRKEAHEGSTSSGWAMGPREVELAACGSFFLREPRPEGDALFPSLPTFSTPVEFEDLLRWWLDHPEERERVAARAREAIAPRTFQHTAATLLRLVDGVPITIR